MSPFVLVIAIIWLVVLSLLFFLYIRHYRRLVGRGGGNDLRSILENYSSSVEEVSSTLRDLSERVGGVESASLDHIQKVGLVRFNPFGDTGGDQSFAITLLDADGTGVVFSSLHGREGTRMYGKPVRGGTEAGHEFSKEEREAIEQALQSDAH